MHALHDPQYSELHFNVAGGLLFLGSHWRGKDEAAPGSVQVSDADIQRLSTRWT